MTAVAPPPFQNIPKSTWGPNSANGYHTMNGDEGPRMLMSARKPATRSNSSSSLSSVSSNASTVSAGSNGVSSTSVNGDSRKRPLRGYAWPGKSEPMTGLSTGRAQPAAPVSFHASAMSSMSSLSGSSGPSNGTMPTFQDARPNGARPFGGEGAPLLCLTPMNGTFERKNLQVPFYPEVIRIGRQTNAKSAPTPINGYFDSKVLSRSHAEIWADQKGKIWIRDIKSSNGTFVNGQRLSAENKDSEPHELHEQDMLELGIDIVSEDQKTVVHHKVAARVEHAGFASGQNLMEVFNMAADMDPSNPQHQINAQFNHMRRNSGQNGQPGMRPNGAVGMTYQQRQQPFLLGPINIEQVIKKLSAEHKFAKQQQYELQRSSQYLDSILSSQPQSKAGSMSSVDSKGKSPIREAVSRSRFSDPPNPPPQAPLPDKPFDQPPSGLLRRTDTEKPKIPLPANGSLRLDSAMASQFASLKEALGVAQKDAEEHRKKLTEMQQLLVEERTRREHAEARAKQLEREHIHLAMNGSASKEEEQSTTPIEEEANSSIGMKREIVDETTTAKLQKRLEALQREYQEVQQSADQWRTEKEEAERERDTERQEKSSLLDLVDKYRSEERERGERRELRKTRKLEGKVTGVEGDYDAEDETEEIEHHSPGSRSPRSKNLLLNGTSALLSGRDGGTLTHQITPLRHSTPYVSALSVVLLGVAIMTLMNRMSKNEQ